MLGWKVCRESIISNHWDIYWTDSAVRSDHLARLQRFQRINHFPGMVCIHRKNNLARNLLRLRKRFPEEYAFFPETYLLPSDMGEFTSQFKGKVKTFIMKPEGAAQGRGIFLVQSPDQVPPGEHLIAQKYITKPYLINGLKFDLRVYILVAGCDPLRVYVYKEGLARFATAPYATPSKKNLGNTFMHLTNYAINKHNPDFQENQMGVDEANKNTESGHKQSMSFLFEQMRKQNANVDQIWKEIKLIAVKTLCAAQPQLAHSYKSGQPDDQYNHMCFEILGLDIIITQEGNPMLLEVNHTPSFSTGSQLDFDVKSQLICDALKLMNISEQMRKKIQAKEKKQTEQRVLTGKRPKIHKSDRDTSIRRKQEERDHHILANLGNFEEVYPSRTKYHDEDIEKYLLAAHEEYQLATSGMVVAKRPTLPSAENTLAGAVNSVTSSGVQQAGNDSHVRVTTALAASESQERIQSSNIATRTIKLQDARLDLKDHNITAMATPQLKVFRMSDGFGKRAHQQMLKNQTPLHKYGLFKPNRNSFIDLGHTPSGFDIPVPRGGEAFDQTHNSQVSPHYFR